MLRLSNFRIHIKRKTWTYTTPVVHSVNMNTVRLATLNLHHLKEWEARKKEVVQLVREVQPDILLVQEARTADEINQIEFLAAECNFPHSGFHAFCMKRARNYFKGCPTKGVHIMC